MARLRSWLVTTPVLLATACSPRSAPETPSRGDSRIDAAHAVHDGGPLDGDGTSLDADQPGDGSRGPLTVEASDPVAVQCTDSGFVPMAPADLDGDGQLERVAARRQGDAFVVSVHSLPELAQEQTFTERADWMEVSITRRGSTTAGDLWVHGGVLLDEATSRWSFTLKRLEGGSLTTVWTSQSSSRPNLRLDVDGDGQVDPILPGARYPEVVVSGETVPIRINASHGNIHGLALPYGGEEAVDLDGDGDREVVVAGTKALLVAEVPSFRTLMRRPSRGTQVAIVPWKVAPRGLVIAALTGVLRRPVSSLFAAQPGFRTLMEYPRKTKGQVVPALDPAGDGSVLGLDVAGRTALLSEVKQGPAPMDLELMASGEPAEARLGPVRLAGGEGPEVLARKVLRGPERTTYEIRALTPPGDKGPGRLIRQGQIGGHGGVNVTAVDLDGDGLRELLVEELSATRTKGGGSSISRWVLIRGDGTELLVDEARSNTVEKGQRQDDVARAAVVELGGGVSGLRFRTEQHEWWWLPSGRDGSQIPACLE